MELQNDEGRGSDSRLCQTSLQVGGSDLAGHSVLAVRKGLFHSEADSEDSTAYLKLRPSKLPRSLQPSSVNHPKDPSSLIHDSVFLEDVPGEVHGRIILAESASGPMATGSDAIVVAQSPGSPNPPSHNGLLP